MRGEERQALRLLIDRAKRAQLVAERDEAMKEQSVVVHRITHCKHGHELTTENARYRTNGARDCMICRRRWKKSAKLRLRIKRAEARVR